METEIANIANRFMSHVYPEPNTGCWLWGACADRKGYGFFGINKKIFRAHRVAYRLFVGEIKNQICHSCDNPSCVNPEHLWDGTSHENTLDMVRKKRHRSGHQSGVYNPNAKLSPENILRIRTSKQGNKALANELGVCAGTIYRIRRKVGIRLTHRKGTHCKNGHEYTPENTITNRLGWRICKTCKQTWDMKPKPKRVRFRVWDKDAKKMVTPAARQMSGTGRGNIRGTYFKLKQL